MPITEILQKLVEAQMQLAQLVAQATEQNAQALQNLIQVMSAPTQVETPRGTYTARKVMQ